MCLDNTATRICGHAVPLTTEDQFILCDDTIVHIAASLSANNTLDAGHVNWEDICRRCNLAAAWDAEHERHRQHGAERPVAVALHGEVDEQLRFAAAHHLIRGGRVGRPTSWDPLLAGNFDRLKHRLAQLGYITSDSGSQGENDKNDDDNDNDDNPMLPQQRQDQQEHQEYPQQQPETPSPATPAASLEPEPGIFPGVAGPQHHHMSPPPPPPLPQTPTRAHRHDQHPWLALHQQHQQLQHQHQQHDRSQKPVATTTAAPPPPPPPPAPDTITQFESLLLEASRLADTNHPGPPADQTRRPAVAALLARAEGLRTDIRSRIWGWYEAGGAGEADVEVEEEDGRGW